MNCLLENVNDAFFPCAVLKEIFGFREKVSALQPDLKSILTLIFIIMLNIYIYTFIYPYFIFEFSGFHLCGSISARRYTKKRFQTQVE